MQRSECREREYIEPLIKRMMFKKPGKIFGQDIQFNKEACRKLLGFIIVNIIIKY